MYKKEKSFDIPNQTQKIQYNEKKLIVPENPIIIFIVGDGTGPEIWSASKAVFDSAVEKAYKGKRKIFWKEALAGEKAYKLTGKWLPDETLKLIKEFRVAIKGPLSTPVGGGIRSLNVELRQKLNLYACVRPVKHIKGVPSPVKNPEKVDMVIFRENMEDVYAGIEWKYSSKEARELAGYLKRKFKVKIPENSGIGIKPISEKNTKNLVRMAIQYCIDHNRKSITLVHKGNIMKFTEGAFREWGYEVAREEFASSVISEEELEKNYNGKLPQGKVVIKDRIADSMFQQVLLRPDEYDVIATPNLNGDYLSDALSAQVGGLGMAPGANMGNGIAVFEATHGSAPKYAGKDMVNPSSLILSGAMMFDYIGWKEVSTMIQKTLERTISQKLVTYDLHRLMKNAKKLKCSEFAKALIKNL